jgi:hypothetical protein
VYLASPLSTTGAILLDSEDEAEEVQEKASKLLTSFSLRTDSE